MANGGFFKGEKKKPKKDKEMKGQYFNTGSAPTFTLPEKVEKKKNR